MTRISAPMLLQLSVLVLALFATTNSLPLEDRLEKLTQEFVRKKFLE